MNKEIENEKVVVSSLVRKSPPIARIFSLGRTRERSRKRERIEIIQLFAIRSCMMTLYIASFFLSCNDCKVMSDYSHNHSLCNEF